MVFWRRRKPAPPDAGALEALREAGSCLWLPHDVRHYLYFRREAGARQAARRLQAAGYGTDLGPSAVGDDWLLLVTHRIVPEASALDVATREVTKIGSEHGGRYDGWEAAVNRGEGGGRAEGRG